MRPIIRPATAADRDVVRRLATRLASFDLPAWRSGPEVVEGDRRALDAWFGEPHRPGETILIADIEGHPVGVAYLVTLVDYFQQRSHGHLSVLAVDERAEGRGVGSALLDAAAAWSRERGFDRLTLSVFAGNHRAQTLYKRHGFEAETVRYVRML